MKSYAYRVYKNARLNEPVYSGAIHALSMEDVVRLVIKSCKIEVIHNTNSLYPEHYFMLNGVKVGILVYASPEYC
jgi:hypothetical protein